MSFLFIYFWLDLFRAFWNCYESAFTYIWFQFHGNIVMVLWIQPGLPSLDHNTKWDMNQMIPLSESPWTSRREKLGDSPICLAKYLNVAKYVHDRAKQLEIIQNRLPAFIFIHGESTLLERWTSLKFILYFISLSLYRLLYIRWLVKNSSI